MIIKLLRLFKSTQVSYLVPGTAWLEIVPDISAGTCYILVTFKPMPPRK